MQLYSILDENNYITHCEWHNECPANGTPLLNTEFKTPRLVDGFLIETHITTAEEIAEIQNELKKQQYQELLPTDWYVVRFLETGIAIPQNILNERQMIRNKY